MKKRLRIIIPLLVLVVIALVLFNSFKDSGDASALRISGNIEVTEAQMSFRIPGRLEARLVDEGDAVRSGQPLARLEKTDQKIAVTRAEADLSYAESVLAELNAGSRSQEIEAARAEYDKALAAEKSVAVNLAQAETDYQRYAALLREGGVSRRMYETYATQLKTAKNARDEAGSRVRIAAEQLDLRRSGPRREAIDQAGAKVKVAVEVLNQARQQLAYTDLTSPLDGVVLSTSAEAGEYLNPATPVLTLGRIAQPWLRAYINERDLGRIQLQQKVSVTTDSFPGKVYAGRISFISSQAEFTPKSVQTFEERVKLMYRVKIDLENPAGELKPGMPADAVIDLAAR
jgi:HlyD family secretion protein